MDLSEDFRWMLCKTNFIEYILQSIAYKTIKFLFNYFAFFSFSYITFRSDVRSAEKEYIHNYGMENK